ncbi:MAG: hypothetical protein HC801_06475 [Nitrospira sp.]|nr:hypothetical protein [Nitrospira sp.]
MVQFAQRIGVEYVLESLSEDETMAYMDHRLQVAGRQSRLFTTLASRVAFRLTGGIPRLINQLCDHALVYGYAEQAETITAHVLLAAATARAKHGVLPLVVSPEDVELSEHELAAERIDINTFTVASVSAEGKAIHPVQVQYSETITVQDPSSVYRKAVALKESGEYTNAIGVFNRLATEDSWAVKALAQKGLCLKAVGKYDDALRAMQEASIHRSATEDESREVRYLLARTLESQKRYGEARELYVALNQGQTKYRDVSARLERLPRTGQDLERARAKQGTRLAAFWRGCEQFLRGAHR